MSTRTSRAAYQKAMRSAKSVKDKILAALEHHGATPVDWLCAYCNSPHQTISARVSELYKAGKIKDSGITRKTRYDRDAICWELA